MPTETEPRPWLCPNCAMAVATPFCGRCGERPIGARDLTVRGAFDRVVQALTSLDGRLLRTVGQLVRRPGALTQAYVEGRRKPWAPPFQVFLVANLLFFGVQSLTGINVLGASLESHMHLQDWQALARQLVDWRLQAAQTTLAAYAPVFDRSVVLYAKSLVILMTLPFTALLALVFGSRQKPFMTHVAFSLHLYALLMLLFSLAIVIGRIDVAAGGAGLASARMDNVLSATLLVAGGAYLYAALGPAYEVSGWRRSMAALLLTIAAAALVLGYRFAVFLIALAAT